MAISVCQTCLAVSSGLDIEITQCGGASDETSDALIAAPDLFDAAVVFGEWRSSVNVKIEVTFIVRASMSSPKCRILGVSFVVSQKECAWILRF